MFLLEPSELALGSEDGHCCPGLGSGGSLLLFASLFPGHPALYLRLSQQIRCGLPGAVLGLV